MSSSSGDFSSLLAEQEASFASGVKPSATFVSGSGNERKDKEKKRDVVVAISEKGIDGSPLFNFTHDVPSSPNFPYIDEDIVDSKEFDYDYDLIWFDLDGNIILDKKKGYSLPELTEMARSHVSAQRLAAFEILGKIVKRSHLSSSSSVPMYQMIELLAVQYGLLVLCSMALNQSRNLSILFTVLEIVEILCCRVSHSKLRKKMVASFAELDLIQTLKTVEKGFLWPVNVQIRT